MAEQEKEKDLTQELVKKAKEGKLSEFQLITNWDEYRGTKLYLKSVKQVEKAFRLQAKDDLKKYMTLVKHGIDNASLLVRQRDMRICQEFYDQEVTTANNMCVEYEIYLTKKLRWVSAFLGDWERPEEDMRDFTKGW